MRYRKLNGTDLNLSEFGFGTWTVSTGWWVNYTDTADAYGNGRGETILKPLLKKRRDLIVGTKFGYDFYNNPERPRGQRELPQDMSPKFIRFACEQSLHRLGIETIAIYQPHSPRVDVLMQDEHWDTLQSLKREGKILSYGPSLGPAIGWRDEGIYATAVRKAPVTQMIYNMLEQDPGREFILAAERGASYPAVGEAMRGETHKKLCTPTQHYDSSFRAWKADPEPQFLVRVPHSSGMLEGKYTIDTKFDESDHRSHRPRAWLVEGLQKVDRLLPLCKERGVTIGQLALLWLYAHPSIVSALPNIYEAAQLHEFAAASDHPPLSDAEMARVQELYERNFDVVPYAEEAVAK